MMRILTPSLPLPRFTTVGGVQRYSWPSQRHLTPTHCDHCGARLLLSDIPTADAPLVDVSCLYCSRVACELAHDGLRRPMTPEEFRAQPTSQGRRGRLRREVTP